MSIIHGYLSATCGKMKVLWSFQQLVCWVSGSGWNWAWGLLEFEPTLPSSGLRTHQTYSQRFRSRIADSCALNTEINQTLRFFLLFISHVYRNMQCVYFSLYLYKLGVAPQIQDLLGKVAFTGSCLLKICILFYSIRQKAQRHKLKSLKTHESELPREFSRAPNILDGVMNWPKQL